MSTKTESVIFASLFLCLAGFVGFWNISDVSADVYGGAGNQGFVKSVNDANLMFEFLLNGLVIDHDNNVALRDEEMASMRQGRAFLALINDNIPKTAPAMEDLLVTLEDHENSLPQHRFERLILGTAYSAYQVQHQNLESEKKVWGNILGRLANATFVQLRKSS